ncbi:hypothetical protein LDENG_00282310, partial [Lucifuga dentata]
DGDIPPPDKKGNLTESDSSSSETSGTSAEESSEEEEDEEENEEKDEDLEACPDDAAEGDTQEPEVEDSNNGSVSGPVAEAFSGNDEVHFKFCCEKCKAIQQSHDNEQVTPRRISKGRLQVQLEGEGTYECSVTGLVFEVSERVLVCYSVLSWSKFGMFLRGSWKFAGPIFNVDTVNKDASVLKSIQFPHSLCLADPENEMTFSVLHIKDNRPIIEPTVNHSGSHVKWRVTSLSPVGPIVQTNQSVEHHGVVLVYKQLGEVNNNSYSFRIYLATNNSSDIKDICKEVRSSKRRYMKIEKPPTCKLDERNYRLLSEPEGEINPEDLKFTLAVTKLKGYFEAFFEQHPPFKLSVIETESDQIVWSATIREGDCVDNTAEKPRKRTDIGRKRSSSASEEEISSKRPRWQDESDGVKTAVCQGQDLSEKQLLQVAKRLGKEWKQVAIYLDLSSRELEDIQATEKDVTMQKLKMLVEWKSRRRPGEATARHLRKSLEDLEDLPNEVDQILKDGVKTAVCQGQDLSEKQLLQVAKRLGKEWKQVAIYLDLSSRELEDIQATEKDVTMQKLKMLVEWKSRRRPGEATARHLRKSLEDLEDLPNEVDQILKDGVKTAVCQGQDLSEKQLLQVAKRLGKEWKQVAIYLDLSSRELEDIQATEKDVTMQKLKMLVEWKSRRRPGEATARHLRKSLEDLEDLPNEVDQILKGNTPHVLYKPPDTHNNDTKHL